MRYLARIVCVVVLGLLPHPALSQDKESTSAKKVETGRIVSRTYYFEEAEKEMGYALFVPKGYDNSKKYPLIVALHGLGATPQIMLRYPGFTDLAQKHGYILVAPMGYNTRGWYGVMGARPRLARPANLGELSERDVMNVLAFTEKEFSIDPDRVYLMGHSMGGGGAWHLGLKHPNKWAALAPIAPAIFRAPTDLEKIQHLPVIVVQGDKDRLVPVSGARKWVKRMEELKMKHVYIEVQGGGHVRPAFDKLPDVFAFFNKYKREERVRGGSE